MVKRTMADVYALAWVACVVFIIVTAFYGLISAFGVGGLSFHPERVIAVEVVWFVLAVVFRYLFFKEFAKVKRVE